MTDTRIRPARPADLDALLALEALFPGDRLSPRQFRHHLRNPRARLRVLRRAGRPLGYALLLLRHGSRVARLYSIVVDPAERGRGHGARLLDDAERQARRAGAAELRLEVRTDNEAAAALYEGRGYRRLGQRAAYYDDGAAAWRYGRSLRR
jgi:[ribosomal protein S18]-alanine N-acetyltransferase